MSIRGRRSLEAFKSKDSHSVKPSFNRAKSEVVSNANKRLPISSDLNSIEVVLPNQGGSKHIRSIFDSFQSFKDFLKCNRSKKSQKEINKDSQNDINKEPQCSKEPEIQEKGPEIKPQIQAEAGPNIKEVETIIKEEELLIIKKEEEVGPTIKEVEPTIKEEMESVIVKKEEPIILEVEDFEMPPIIKEVGPIIKEVEEDFEEHYTNQNNNRILENEFNLKNPKQPLKKRRPLRMLFLHGYKMNVRSFYEETDYIRNQFDDLVEFTYVQAPHFISEECAETNFQEQHAWWLKTKEFPWIHFPEVFEKTMEFMNRVFIMHGPFDGIFGFSQGGAFTAILCNIITHKQFGNKYNAIDFKFAIVVGTFRYDEEYLWQFYDSKKKLQIPTFHIFGRSDTVIPWQSSYGLTDFFHNPKVFFHEQGHCIPYESLPEIRTFLEELEVY